MSNHSRRVGAVRPVVSCLSLQRRALRVGLVADAKGCVVVILGWLEDGALWQQ